ncbi:MAG: tetratricopeptide repeat protein [Clostridium sp.]|nr:tetratricopeptide repeat protein [Bacteroides sp.]MCM1197505.1 tetratricopeptide repeat protein [Clostridium sp.]
MFFILCVPFLFYVQQNAAAQSYRIERNRENLLVDAVLDFDMKSYSEAERKLKVLLDNASTDDAAHYYMGLSKLLRSDFEAAEKELKEAVRLDPGNFWYRYRLAALYSITGRPELTESMYVEMLKDFPKKSDLYYNLVETYMSQGKMAEALETLGQIETVFGKSEPTAMARFDILCRLDRQPEAFESLVAYNKEYSSPQVLSVLADWQMSMYNDSTALAMYDEALDIAPDYAPALLGKAEAYRITRKYTDYFKIMGDFLSREDISASGKSDYLKALTQGTDPNFLKNFRPQIDSMFTACIKAHPGDSTAMTGAGIYYYSTGRGNEAAGYFRRNMENWPASLSAAANYSEVLMYLHEWDSLSVQARKSYADFPSEPAFLELAVLADYNLKKYDNVLETCSRILSISPADSARTLNAYTTIGDIYHLKGENKNAYKAYQKALKINSDHLPVLNNYAYYLSVEGKQLKKAAVMSRKTVEKEPDNPTYLDTYGWILYLQGNLQEAKRNFKHAMLYGGRDNAVILDHYAEVLYALGEYDEAFVYWNQALAKDKSGDVPGLEQKVNERRSAVKK